MRNQSRYPHWLVSFAAEARQAQQVRTAGVEMESGNKGDTKPSSEPAPAGFDNGGDDRQKAFKDNLQDVSLSKNPKDEETQRIQRDTQMTSKDIAERAKKREKISEGGEEGAKAFFYPTANKSGKKKTYAQSDLVKLVYASTFDILSTVNDVLQHAEEFVHQQIPLGQRDQVFSSIEKTLRTKGIGTRFNRAASEKAPSSGFDNYTWSDVANFIEDDFRSAPQGFINESPDSYNKGERTRTSIENTMSATPTAKNDYTKRTPALARKKALLALAKKAGMSRRAYEELLEDLAMEEDSADTLMIDAPTGGEDMVEEHQEFEKSEREIIDEIKPLLVKLNEHFEELDTIQSDEEEFLEESEDLDLDLETGSEEEVVEDEMEEEFEEDSEYVEASRRLNRFVKAARRAK